MPEGNGDWPVVIVGGGPVGLALSIELGWRGVRCLLVEQGDGDFTDTKMFLPGIRTVEFCRRWGIAERVKHWGFPLDRPFDNIFVTSLVGYELGRMPLPSIADTPPNPGSPEQYAHCPQTIFDRLLAERARSMPSVTLRFKCEMQEFRQDAEGVDITLVDRESGRREQVRARHLVGCDGYHSSVRDALGIKLEGREFIARSLNVMFRAKGLDALHGKPLAGRYVIIGDNGRPWGSMIAADGIDQWRIMLTTDKDSEVGEISAEDMVRRAVGRDFDFEMAVGHWVRRAMVAEHYGKGRVFLAGDAVHVMPPNGGLGMNTGIGDVVDLGWKLAAVEAGWGGPNLLASYEPERRPVGWRSVQEATRYQTRLNGKARDADLLAPGPKGDAIRAELGQRLVEANLDAWSEPDFIHLGYRYDNSPIIVDDGTPPPPDPERPQIYQQTSRPGARAPHAWLADGRSTIDLFGRNFTLLRLGRQAPADGGMRGAAGQRNVPLDLVEIADEEIAALYERRLVLVRPDGHVAWRGDTPPAEPTAIFDRVRGA